MTYLGLDPLLVAVFIGVFTSLVSIAFYFMGETSWHREQIINAVFLVALMVPGWAVTSYPWVWALVLTMTAVAYGVNQVVTNLVIGISKANRKRTDNDQ